MLKKTTPSKRKRTISVGGKPIAQQIQSTTQTLIENPPNNQTSQKTSPPQIIGSLIENKKQPSQQSTEKQDKEEEEAIPRLSISEQSTSPPEHISELLTEEKILSDNELDILESTDAEEKCQQDKEYKKRMKEVYDYIHDKKFIAELKSFVADILEHIRFPLLQPHELYDYVEPSKIVPKKLLLEAYRAAALGNRAGIPSTPRLKIREGSLFYKPGVLENVPLKLLRGWTCCYHKPYSGKFT